MEKNGEENRNYYSGLYKVLGFRVVELRFQGLCKGLGFRVLWLKPRGGGEGSARLGRVFDAWPLF